MSADPETLRALADFSEREINKATGLARRIIRHIRHKGQVKPSTMQRIVDYLIKTKTEPQGRAVKRKVNRMPYKNPEDKRRWEQEHREQRNARRRQKRLKVEGRTTPENSGSTKETISGWKLLTSIAIGIGGIGLAVLAGIAGAGGINGGTSGSGK